MSETLATCEPLEGASTIPAVALKWTTEVYLPYMRSLDLDGEIEGLSVSDIAEPVATFFSQEGRLPRCGEEMDAWSNSADDWQAYQLANPVAPPAESVKLAEEKLRAVALAAKEEGDRSAAAAKSADYARQSVKAVTAASKSELHCLLRAGHFAILSLRESFLAGEKARHSLVKSLAAKYFDATRVDWNDRRVSEMIRCAAARELLDPSCKVKIDYSAYAKGFSTLVERSKDPLKEEYFFMEGIEAEARALFLRCTGNGLSVETICDECRELVTKAKGIAADNARRRKEESDKAEAQQRAEAQRAAEELKKKEEEREALTQANVARVWTDTEEDKAARIQAEEDARKKDAEVKAAQEKKEREEDAARKARMKAKADEQASKEASERLAAQRKKDQAKENRTATSGPAKGPESYVKIAVNATAKDFAGYVCDGIAAHAEPDDVFLAICAWVNGNPDMGKAAQRAAKAALDASK